MKNKFDAVFYDFDGTIADSIPVIMMSFHKAYEEVLGRCDRSDEDLRSYIGKPLETTFEMHDKETAKKLLDAYLAFNEQLLRDDKVEIFPGVEDDLRYLKSLGIKQGIMTSKRRVSCMITLENRGLTDIFDTFVFKEDSQKHKPDKEPLVVAAAKAGLPDPSRILYVGDALPDLLCARNAKSGFALVNWTKMPIPESEMTPETYVLQALRDISCIISGAEL